jgi:hypothetical protein
MSFLDAFTRVADDHRSLIPAIWTKLPLRRILCCLARATARARVVSRCLAELRVRRR